MPLSTLSLVPATHPAGWKNNSVAHQKGSLPFSHQSIPISISHLLVLPPLPPTSGHHLRLLPTTLSYCSWNLDLGPWIYHQSWAEWFHLFRDDPGNSRIHQAFTSQRWSSEVSKIHQVSHFQRWFRDDHEEFQDPPHIFSEMIKRKFQDPNFKKTHQVLDHHHHKRLPENALTSKMTSTSPDLKTPENPIQPLWLDSVIWLSHQWWLGALTTRVSATATQSDPGAAQLTAVTQAAHLSKNAQGMPHGMMFSLNSTFTFFPPLLSSSAGWVILDVKTFSKNQSTFSEVKDPQVSRFLWDPIMLMLRPYHWCQEFFQESVWSSNPRLSKFLSVLLDNMLRDIGIDDDIALICCKCWPRWWEGMKSSVKEAILLLSLSR